MKWIILLILALLSIPMVSALGEVIIVQPEENIKTGYPIILIKNDWWLGGGEIARLELIEHTKYCRYYDECYSILNASFRQKINRNLFNFSFEGIDTNYFRVEYKKGGGNWTSINYLTYLQGDYLFRIRGNEHKRNTGLDWKMIFSGKVINDLAVWIPIVDARHLNRSRDFISDVTNETLVKDNIWSERIYSNEYVRATFAENLTSQRDITIYVRNTQGLWTYIEVYELNSTEIITTFPAITHDGYYQVDLWNLTNRTQDTFDLKVVNNIWDSAFLEFDYIYDAKGISDDSLTCNAGNLLLGQRANCTGQYDNTDTSTHNWNLFLQAGNNKILNNSCGNGFNVTNAYYTAPCDSYSNGVIVCDGWASSNDNIQMTWEIEACQSGSYTLITNVTGDTANIAGLDNTASVSNINPNNISSCGTLGTSNTVYTQGANIIPSSTCIILTGNNSIFNGNGYSISNLSAKGSIFNGIITINGQNNTVRNTNISALGSTSPSLVTTAGIYTGTGVIDKITIINNTIYTINSFGISVACGLQNSTISNNYVYNSYGGTSWGHSAGCFMKNITISNNVFNNDTYGSVFAGESQLFVNNTYINTINATWQYGSGGNGLWNIIFKDNIINNTKYPFYFENNILGDMGNISLINNRIYKTGTDVNLYDLQILDTGTPTMGNFYIINTSINNYSMSLANTLTYGNDFGNISFILQVSGSSTNLSDDIRVSSDLATVNSQNFNTSADITLTGLSTSYTLPKIYYNSIQECNSSTTPKCYNLTSLNAGTVRFNVTQWTNYSIVETGGAPPEPPNNTCTAPPANQNWNVNSNDNCTYTNLTVVDLGSGNLTLYFNSLNTYFILNSTLYVNKLKLIINGTATDSIFKITKFGGLTERGH